MTINDAAKSVLAQLIDAVKQLGDDEYTKPIPRLGNSSLGQHVRHTLEFFTCLFDGTQLGVVNYDLRERDNRIESSPAFALTVIRQIYSSLEKMDPDEEIILITDYSLDQSHPVEIRSNVARELSYNIEHAIHHMAILKIGIAEVAGAVELPEGFGIAVSTLRYMSEVAAEQG